MSGGHWNYHQHALLSCVDEVCRDVEVKKRFPGLVKVLRDVGDVLEDMIHELDLDLSGDCEIGDDRIFEAMVIEKLRGLK